MFITGTSRGIGRAVALLLAASGWHVFAGVRHEDDGRRLLEEAHRTGSAPRLEPVLVDVADVEAVRAAAAQVDQRVGSRGLAALVGNAGVVLLSPLELVPPEAFDHQMRVNATGQLVVAQAFLPLLRRYTGWREAAEDGMGTALHRRGSPPRIVLMGSTAGRLPTPLLGAYCASKFALRAVADVLRFELRQWGIGVVLVEPGFIDTDMSRSSLERMDELAVTLEAAARGAGPEPASAGLPAPSVLSYYARFVAASSRFTEKERLSPPEEVARLVLRLLEAQRVRASYGVGANARLEFFLARLPVRLRDRILAWALTREMATQAEV